MYVYIYIYRYTYIKVYMYICLYLYTHIHTCDKNRSCVLRDSFLRVWRDLFYAWSDSFLCVTRLLHTGASRIFYSSHIYIYKYIHTYIHIYIYIHIYMYIGVCVCIYIFIYIYVYLYIYAGASCILGALHNSFLCVHMCDMTHSYGYNLTLSMCDITLGETWLIHMCDTTHSYIWHNSFICMTWLIHMRDMTHSMCDVTHSYE